MAVQRKNGISWTDETFSPLVGCTKVGEGCRNCWAEKAARLHYHDEFPNGWDGHVKLFPERLEQPLHWRKPRRIAVGLMGDLFHKEIPVYFQENVFRTAISANQHTFQFLTKRADLMAWRIPMIMNRIYGSPENWTMPKNIWLGVSVEDQKTADERIPLLLQTPAAIRWVSAEPLLGPIDLEWALHKYPESHPFNIKTGLDWVICGSESGPKRRPCDVEWIRSMRNQCIKNDISFHIKQMDINGALTKAPALDNVVWLQFPEAKA